MRGIVVLIIGILCWVSVSAQTLGGNTVFNFLAQPNDAQLSSLGGVNISAIGNNLGLAFQDPALLRPAMNGQVSTSFNSFLAGIRNYSLTSGWKASSLNTNFAAGVNYFDYGSIPQTDAS